MRRLAWTAALLLLIACDGTPELAGRWEQGMDRVEFFADGTVVLRRLHWSGAGEYAFVEPDRVVVRFGAPFDSAGAGDYRVRVQGDTARLCETYRPGRCMTLLRAAADWVEGPGRWVDTVPLRLAEPPRLGRPADGRVTSASLDLRQAHALQTVFLAEQGRYARTPDELEAAGWQADPAGAYTLEIVRADPRLCMVARPVRQGLPPLYVNADGQVGFGDACP